MSEQKISFNTLLTVGGPVLAIAATFYALQGKVETVAQTVSAQGTSIERIAQQQSQNVLKLSEIGSDVKQLRSLLYEKRILREAPLAKTERPGPDTGFNIAVSPVVAKPIFNPWVLPRD